MSSGIYRCNPEIVLREEDASGTLLFNPDTGDVLILNRTGRFVWDSCLDGSGLDGILEGLRRAFDDVPPEAAEEVASFLSVLAAGGFIEPE